MKIIKIITIISAFVLSACSTPKPVEQDGSQLWLANGRSYEEILNSVETKIDNSLAKKSITSMMPTANVTLTVVPKRQSVMEYMP